MRKTNLCVVCEYGWIIIGIPNGELTDNAALYLTDASVVRRWDNGKGIGGIAKAENKDEYVLDEIGDVVIRQSKVLFTIPCEW